MEKQQPTLSLRVLNSEQLESGRSASCLFSAQGGTVGSSESHLWSVQDQQGNIHPSQFSVQWRDGAFCLQVLAEPVQINNAALTPQSSLIRLQQGDQIKAGNLSIKIHISFSDADRVDPSTVSPESLVSSYSNPLDAMMEGAVAQKAVFADDNSIAPTIQHSFSDDPLRVLDSESLTTLKQQVEADDTEQLLPPDHFQSPPFANPISDNRGSVMDQEFLDLPGITSERQYADMDVDHVAITPLMRGLDAQLPLHDSQQANDFLQEMGKTMKAAIEGLLALQREQHGLRDKQLRPIEDNPLRLNMDYDTTMQVMFSDQKSPVHLSAPAAVSESLHNLQLHYQANREAISAALDTMLEAFSPEQLLRRFSHYRRSNEVRNKDAAWAWEMYTNYYRELASSRQQGFEKLFREVYEQAYDRALRQGLEDSSNETFR
ncbi:type VI secretion system-associated FHA domain protein TagH [Xenorhabdus bovienii]|uniref:Type VI secretion system-associated FHA domain protein TagH n=1 Tax=Xenorhabdus bovienii TaxID=40576 RepID=A0AAJ1J7K8_XENBV|nr:type VI secretion system-associated FHA domain protein TagH [Xenorhabdus bovienii]MDE1478251.1 type VI secretion system-associated FHA domain protein TagH [Xenorhabdus bovienii]MDE1489651.1 type VI secretion system-associated FHA domain protein TagH [Xenorhabdus bovienii]MDE1493567.1 type VI secretion system-associated FHA domain protein TagH [Xenorhabdus bovienii]MDE9472307.1 type VI secretion system-associated FHA domain protein TagH [Xenorhabdus bovienii]MDE9509954.1 type VI secretion sy